MRRKKIAFALLLLLALLLLCGCGNKGETALPSPTPVPTPEPDYSGQLRISEFMTKNKAALADESGAFPDWVELECIAASPVDLSGWALSDRPGTAKLPLEARMAQPGDYALLFCGEDSFSLSQGETLYLLSPDGKIQDQALCPESASDRSLQRQADGSFAETRWISPGYPNDPAGHEAFAASRPAPMLSIHEVMVSNEAHPLTGDLLCDWVELHNDSGAPLALAGYSLSDSLKEPARFVFPERTLQPGELLVLACEADGLPEGTEIWNTGFSLDAVQEQLYLFSPQGNLVDYVSLEEIPIEGSLGRQDGTEGFLYFTEPSPGQENLGGERRVSARPVALTPDGIYDDVESVSVALSAAGEIRYTLDGSQPGPDSALYEGPITLTETTVLRAASWEEGAVKSRAASFSYIINEHHTLPVLSLAVDSQTDFNGMYASTWEGPILPANLSMYESDGLLFSQDCRVRLQGRTSLILPKKGLGIRFGGRYGGNLHCDVFGNGITEYSSLTLRVGQDYAMSLFRNELFQALMAEASDDVLVQATRFCILYVNGDYYGIYALKEDFSRQFYASHAGVSKESVAHVNPPAGSGSDFYIHTVDFVESHDMTLDENYEELGRYLNLDSLIDWVLFEGYAADQDIYTNYRMFSSPENGGAWQLAYYDLDICFFHLSDCFLTIGNEGELPTILRYLGRNAAFRERLLSRYAELGRTTLSDEHVLQKICECEELLAPEIPRNHARWDISPGTWESQVDFLKQTVQSHWFYLTSDVLRIRFDCTQEEYDKYFSEFKPEDKGGIETWN